jgi:hypothetical protein
LSIREGYFIKSRSGERRQRSEDDRRKAEDSVSETSEGTRQARPAAAARWRASERAEPDQPPKDLDSFLKQSRQPDFIDSASLLRFKFEQGKYVRRPRAVRRPRGPEDRNSPGAALHARAGQGRTEERDRRKADQGQPDPKAQRKKDREDELDATIERLMNKVSLVTIWVEPKSFQIVKCVRQRELRLPAGGVARARQRSQGPR